MMFNYRKWLFVFLLSGLFLLVAGQVLAQNSVDESCASLVIKALDSSSQVCSGLEGDSACYGNPNVTAEAVAGAAVTMSKPGDTAALDDLRSLRTSPVDVEKGEWGVAFVNLESQAADQQPTRFLMLGDVTLINNTSSQPNDAALRAFSFRVGDNQSTCNGAPNKLVLQSPEDSTTDLSFNGADLVLDSGSLVVLDAETGNNMSVLVVNGSVTVNASGGSQVVVTGQMTTLLLGGDNGLVVIAAPTDPTDFDPALIQFLPFNLVTSTISIPAGERWTDTGVELKAGQSYIIMASDLVKTIDYMPWSAPEGHSAADCKAAGRGDWDCKCRTLPDFGTCSLTEVASMKLVGRIGEKGATFVVGAGGFFTAAKAGELFLGPNDNEFDDNVGAYSALIIVNTSTGSS